MMSQKTNAEIINHFWSWPKSLRLDCFTAAFKFIYQYALNSLIVAVISVAGTVFLSSLGGYVFGRLDFRGKKFLFLLVLSLMMVPGILTLIPAFLWYKQFPFVGGNNWLGAGGHGFLDTRWVLIIPYISGGQIFGIFLCRTFFESLPNSLFEAARIDGAKEFQVYLRIGLPLSLPIIATLSIMSFVAIYNDYIWPLVTVADNRIQIFSVGVTRLWDERNLGLGYARVMAGYLIGSIPLIAAFALGMKYYIEGLTKGGIKG
jgi:multiple sugar transport system permease protein